MKTVPRLSGLSLLVLSFVLAQPALAQQEASPVDSEAGQLAQHLNARGECLDKYGLGSVLVTTDVSQSVLRVAPAGQLVVAGTVENTNSYPLPEGRLLARVLRHDRTIADEHWHPVVEEQDVPGNLSLAANESKSFAFHWNVPADAPGGIYRVEFVYLAGGRYSLSGLSFVPNFTATARTFQVANSSTGSALEFDRSSVTLNDSPYALRSVPPSFAPGEPVAVEAVLVNDSSASRTITVTTELHEWSDSDEEPPVLSTSQDIQLAPGDSQAIPFTWDSAVSGVYELVYKATPVDQRVLPSVLKVRFPVEGVAPRIMFSGITAVEGAEAEVTTCVVNGTTGEGTGSYQTTVSASRGELGVAEGSVDSGAVASSTIRVPLTSDTRQLSLAMVARDADGNITDQHTVTYEDELLDDVLPAASVNDSVLLETDEEAPAVFGLSARMITYITLAVAGVVILLSVAMLVYRRRRQNEIPIINKRDDYDNES